MPDTATADELVSFVRSVSTSEISPELAADGRTVTVRLVPYDAPRRVVDASQGPRAGYMETFVRGGLIVPAANELPVTIEREHDGPVVGVLAATEDREDGLYGTIRLSRSTAGADMAADLEERIYRYVSVDFLDRPLARGVQSVVRSAARLRRVAFTLTPQHDAPVVSLRSTPTPESDPNMPDTLTPAAPEAPAPTTAEVAPPAAPAPELAVSQRSRPEMPGGPLTGDTATALASLGQYESFGHFVRAAAAGEIDGPELLRYQRALADIVTADTTGLIQENWVSEIIDLHRQYTPTVTHWRSRPLPATGMSISQPIVDTRPTVGEQTTQKTDITSTDVVIDFVQWAIKTYAGGSDISIQTIERSTPDLMSELMRLYTRELAQKINAAAVTALLAAAAVGVSGNTALEYVSAAAFDELVISASGSFMLPTKLRRPAEVMALSIDLWKALAGAKDLDGRPLYPSINPMNSHGRMDAVSSEGNAVGIDWYVEPDLGTGIKGVIGVRDAFVSALGPIKTLTADVPAKLGRDVAVYQEATFGASDPTGLVLIVNLV